MTIAIALPLVFYVMLFAVLLKKSPELGWRHAFLRSALLWGTFVVLVTESLSIIDGISYYPLSLAWLAGIGFELYFWSHLKDEHTDPLEHGAWSLFEIVLVSGIAFIAFVVGLIAFSSPPNTIDSLSYHMSRVMHWVQNNNISFYPTHILRQLHQSPWAEFVILHFQVLAGTDRFANSVQWLSMLGSLVGASSIASQMGINRRGQLLTSLCVATLPMGIAQASSTQNDYVLAFWLVCFCYFILLLRSQTTWPNIIFCGISLGLSVLTKATAYLYAAPFVMFGAYMLLQKSLKRGMLSGALIGSIVLAINVGHWARCYELYGNPLGPGRESPYNYAYLNDFFSPSVMASNVVRNVSNQLGTPYPFVNAFFEKSVDDFHITIGISPNDPRTTWPKTTFHTGVLTTSEDNAGNLLYLISIIWCLIYVSIRKDRDWALLLYTAGVLSGFLLFCFFLRWQPWNGRLQLPLFVLAGVLIGWAVSRFPDKLQFIFAAAIFAGALPWVFLNQGRPILTKQNIFNVPYADQYFSYIQIEKPSYVRAVRLLSDQQCSNVGIISDWESWEYPVWTLFKQYGQTPVRIEHVKVKNISEQIRNRNVHGNFKPCGVILMRDNPPPLLTINGVDFVRRTRGYASVYTP